MIGHTSIQRSVWSRQSWYSFADSHDKIGLKDRVENVNDRSCFSSIGQRDREFRQAG